MTALENTFRVAIFDQFLESFARIPRAQQKKVNNFIRKFRANPTASSINYEKINTFADQNLRTVRIDEAYRAIVLKPEAGNLFILLWVDHHDDAMAWAKNKRVAVHPETGGLQVFSLTPLDDVAPTVARPEPSAPAATRRASKTEDAPKSLTPLFAKFSAPELLSLGVPEQLLITVRGLVSVEQLQALGITLPVDCFEALCFLAEGESLDDIRQALDIGPKPAVASSDLAAALDSDASKRSFILVDNDEALSAMLDAPLEKWRLFLHPSQRKLVERSWSGPVRVLGGAGTGKTVVAMHRAAWLLQHRFTADNDRILFTTFTRNLAADIADHLAKLLPPPVLRRVEVVSLDKWVNNFLNGQGYAYQVEYWQSDGGVLAKLWQLAMDSAPKDEGYLPGFFREEWEYVVQPQNCQTEDDYIAAKRAGRGVRLSRAQRRSIWPVFEAYRNLLEEKKLRESVDAMHDAAKLLELRGRVLGYRSIIVDEAQDMSTVAFKLLRDVLPDERPDDIFIVGDGHQRIYRRRVSLKQAGINIVGRSKRLRINYRTTDEIRRFAVAVLEGSSVDDLDGGTDTTSGYRSLMHGSPPQVKVARDFGAEVTSIDAFIKEGDPSRTCLVARTQKLVDTYEEALKARGVATYRIRRSGVDDRSAPGLRLATMHRVKGLEFDRMILAGADANTVPLKSVVTSTSDDAVREDLELQERALLYVALTRAKRDVLITAVSKATPWVRSGDMGAQ